MVSIGEGLIHNIPCLIPRKFLFINQDSKELDGGNRWVSIIKLNLILFRELVPVSVNLFVSTDDVSNGG